MWLISEMFERWVYLIYGFLDMIIQYWCRQTLSWTQQDEKKLYLVCQVIGDIKVKLHIKKNSGYARWLEILRLNYIKKNSG